MAKKNITKKPASVQSAKKKGSSSAPKKAAAKPRTKPPAAKTKTAAKPKPKPKAKPKTAKYPSSGYRKRFLDEIRKDLLLMRERLIRDVTRTVTQETEQTKIDVGDFYDQASDDRDRVLSLLFSERDRRNLSQIEGALKRIDEGTYGICEVTGEKIGEDRLRVMPFARFTIEVQEEMEKAG